MKKTFLFTFLLIVLMSTISSKVHAYDIVVNNDDGVKIYYNYSDDGKELTVTYLTDNNHYNDNRNAYTGTIVIPEEVTYMNRTRKVTSIGSHAFCFCSNLINVTIPNSVINIGEHAFSDCSELNSVTLGNGVTTIGNYAFWMCSKLPSIIIPNSVTSIGDGAFNNCCNLTNVSLGNNLKTIGGDAFSVTNLEDLSIPNSVTTIGAYAFYKSGLRKLFLGKGITYIGESAFHACGIDGDLSQLENLTYIGASAFVGCGIQELTIPKNVTYIGEQAFAYNNIYRVVSKIENPFEIEGKNSQYGRTFNYDTFMNASLSVPAGTIDKYKATEGWKDFVFIEEAGAVKKCAKPTIYYYSKSLLFFKCETEGVTFHSNITDTDMGEYSRDEINLNVTYHVTVYARKAGYEDSDVAEGELCWIYEYPHLDGIISYDQVDMAQVKAMPVLIQIDEGIISVQGAPDGTHIRIFGIGGEAQGQGISQNGQARINTSLQKGSVAVVKIGERAVKVIIQ